MVFVEIKAPNEFNGLWKVSKCMNIVESNSLIRYRYEVYKNDEVCVCEFYENRDKSSDLSIMKLKYETNLNEVSLPPNSVISYDEGKTIYRTLDTHNENRGFDMLVDGKEMIHWEYQTEDKTGCLSIWYYPNSDVIEVFTGITLKSFEYDVF